ncbi:MAG: biotin--[acetyl-CoA-carboxylase] ligase [Clostridia bacterium]|nr:biotin--[acetyl-CoA-carboxylase] ligase [Clostridia bacterium]
MQLKKLKTKFLGRNSIYYKEIDSTQSEIWRLIQSKTAPNGTLVFADIQTKGKGTHGRIWHTDEKGDIAFSFLIQMDCNVKKLEGITIEIAKIIIDILEKQYQIKLEIKEPNDIVYKNKKIGGILTETKVVSENVKYLVIGIGINTKKQHFSKDIENIATSIKKEFNIDINTEEFISEFCNRFEKQLYERIEY